MGVAIDTVVFSATNPGAGGAAAAANAADTLGVRSFAASGKATLEFLARQGATEGFVEVKSPRMHDSTRGLHYITAETPSVVLMPRQTGQPVYSSDAFSVSLSGGGAEVDAGAFGIYYSDLDGSNARIYDWSQLAGSVEAIKPVEVDVAAQATSAGWTDTAINATENLLEANRFYALLGYVVDVACLVVGIKGPETGNYRLCGPGPTQSFPTSDYFLRMNDLHKKPYIPVISANNRANVFCSTALVSTAATPKVELIFALLTEGWTG